MKIRDIELHRRKEIHEYLTMTHMFSFFVMMWALVLYTKLFSIEDYGMTILRILLFFSIGLLIIVLITRYNEKIASQNLIAKFTWVDILYVSFHLVVTAVTIFLVDRIQPT